MSNIRLRLAPSPTGFLHVGNLRTALFGYLLAKSMKGSFILRIEDTDEKREVAGAVESLIKILDWIGIKFDEGPFGNNGQQSYTGNYGPYVQTQRLEIYKNLTEELLIKDGAYHCFCSSEELAAMREEQQASKLPPRYDRRCRHLTGEQVAAKIADGQRFVIRQKLPLTGEVVVHDELRGDIRFNLADLEDHVLIKSDGVPTYQFANIVDDHLMEISHVTRGDEWLPSYPKNILLYQAFGWEPPKFIHLPLILNKTGGKLSKRQGDVFVEQYRDGGYLPEALINFCALLGWHPKHDKEILSLSELEQEFSFDGMGTSPAIFDTDKLDYYNGFYIRQLSDETLLQLVKPYWSVTDETDDYLLKIMPTVKERLKTLADIASLTSFYFGEQVEYESELLIWKSLSSIEVKNNLIEMYDRFNTIDENDWQESILEQDTITWFKAADKKLGDYLWPMRVALTGQKFSPGPFEVAGVLGKHKTINRLQKAIYMLK